MKNLLLATLIMTLGLTACSDKQQSPTFEDNKGEAIRFSALKGRWVIINYWASWCHSCISEIPELNAFYQAHKKRAVVLGVNYDTPKRPALNAAIKKFKITYPVLVQDPRQALQLPDAGVIPTTYIINPRGQVVKRLVGPQTAQKLSAATGLR